MRPDLFESSYRLHFHGYPNGPLRLRRRCLTPPSPSTRRQLPLYSTWPRTRNLLLALPHLPAEHLQMGMVGSNLTGRAAARTGLPASSFLRAALVARPVLTYAKASNCKRRHSFAGVRSRPWIREAHGAGKYAYNDGDGTTRYDVEYPDPDDGLRPDSTFSVGMTLQPGILTDMKGPVLHVERAQATRTRFSQGADAGPNRRTARCTPRSRCPPSSNIPAGGRAAAADLGPNVTEMHTLASLGIPMQVIALNAAAAAWTRQATTSTKTPTRSAGGGGVLSDVILDAK